MTDVIVIAIIVVFFLLAALLVGRLDRLIASSGTDADYEDDPADDPDPEPERPAGYAS